MHHCLCTTNLLLLCLGVDKLLNLNALFDADTDEDQIEPTEDAVAAEEADDIAPVQGVCITCCPF